MMNRIDYTFSYFFITIFAFSLSSHIKAQQQIVFNSNPFMVLSNSAYLVVDNPNDNAIITLPAGSGNIVSENENNVVKWGTATNTGTYVVPFTTSSFVKIPLSVEVINAGAGANASIIFSTYETSTDANIAYPSDVTNLNSNCKDSVGLSTIDRFWRIDANSYTTKPTVYMSFGYDDAANEMIGFNTITESKLKAMRFNSTTNQWETPQKIYGQVNTINNTVSNANVLPADFYKSWTLIDTAILNLTIGLASGSNSICAGQTAIITPTGALSYTIEPIGTIGTSFSVSPIGTITYTISGTSTLGCVSSGTANAFANITVFANPSLSISSFDKIDCNGGTTTVTATANNGTAPYTYNWEASASTTNTAVYGAGIYTVTVFDLNNCKAVTQTVVVTEPTNALTITSDSVVNTCPFQNNGSVVLVINGGTPFYNILWSNGAQGNSVFNLSDGFISATVTDSSGCQTFYSTNIASESCVQIYIPQLFSPNVDSKNDAFEIKGIEEYPNNTLQIFNRWGNLVYEKKGYKNEWTGKANVGNAIGNGLLPAATYFVVLDLGDSKTKPYASFVELRY